MKALVILTAVLGLGLPALAITYSTYSIGGVGSVWTAPAKACSLGRGR